MVTLIFQSRILLSDFVIQDSGKISECVFLLKDQKDGLGQCMQDLVFLYHTGKQFCLQMQ